MRTNLQIRITTIIFLVLVITVASVWFVNYRSSDNKEESSLSYFHVVHLSDTVARNIPDTIPASVAQTLDHGTDYKVTEYRVKNNRTVITGWLDARKYNFKEGARPFTGISALPRELRINNQKENPLPCTTPFDILKLRKEKRAFSPFTVENDYYLDRILSSSTGGTEIVLDITSSKAEIIGLCFFNDKGEKVNLYLSLPEESLVMDRTGSSNSINEVPELAKAPIKKASRYRLDIFLDNYSMEVFLNEGHTTISNLVFPTEPYNRMNLYAKGGSFDVDTFNIYRLGL